jgi:hypothetical protein
MEAPNPVLNMPLPRIVIPDYPVLSLDFIAQKPDIFAVSSEIASFDGK